MHKVHFQPSKSGGVNIFVDGHWMKYTDAFEFKIDKDGYYKLSLSLTVKLDDLAGNLGGYLKHPLQLNS